MALKITFHSNGGNNIPAIENINQNDVPFSLKPEDPTKEGYDFVGWYYDSEFINAFHWELPLSMNRDLYARWIPHDDVTWYLNTQGRNDAVATKWGTVWLDNSYLPVAPGMYSCLCGKTVNTIRFKVGTPGVLTIKVLSNLTNGEVIATRTIDFSDASADDVVTKQFDDLAIGEFQVFALSDVSDTGNIKYPTGVSNWNMKDGQFYSAVGGSNPNGANNVSLNIDVGFKFYDRIPVSRITLDKTSGNIAVGNSTTINAYVEPQDATNNIVQWVVTSGDSIVSISPNKNSCTITGNAIGNATITAVDVDGRVEAVYNLTVANMADVVNHITFVANGGSPVVGMTYQLNSPTFTLPSSTKTGYHFVGWFDNPMLIGDIKKSIPTGSFGDLTLYAKWVKKSTWDKYNGKTLTIMGDSNSTIYTKDCIGGITYTESLCQQYEITENTMWFGQIAQALGMTISERLNVANGLTVMNTTPGKEYDCLSNYRRLSWQKENGIDPGLIYIFAGFNDPLAHSGEIGTFDPTASYVTQLDKETGVHQTFVQAYVLMLTRIMDIYPDSEIVVICPYNFISNTDSKAYSTEQENTQIKAICQYFNIKCIDANDFGVNRGTWPFWPDHPDDDTFDGTHPVNQGFAKIANAVIANMDDGIKVVGIVIDKDQTKVSVGGHTYVKAQVQPENATNQNVSYRIVSGSDNISIEQIGQRCQINGLKIGSAVVEAMSENGGKTVTCTVQVLDESNIPYKHITKQDGTKIQVDSAIRDGSGRKIETKYVRTINGIEPENGDISGISVEGHTHDEYLTSVSWDDVQGKPDIPTKTSDLTNDSDFITLTDVMDAMKDEVEFGSIEATEIWLDGKQLTWADISSTTFDPSNIKAEELDWSTVEGMSFDRLTANSIKVNDKNVSVEGHTHNEYVTMQQIQDEMKDGVEFGSIEADELKVNGKDVSLEGHKHTTSDIEGLENIKTGSEFQLKIPSQLVDKTIDKLVVNKLTSSEYEALKTAGTLNDEELYFIESNDADILDAKGNTVVNVGNPVNLTDAATKGYVDTQVSNARQDVVGMETRIEDNVKEYIDEVVEDTPGKIYLTDEGVGLDDTLSDAHVVKCTHEKYQWYLNNYTREELANYVFVLESDVEDMLGKRVTRVGAPEEDADAATKKYVDDSLSAFTPSSGGKATDDYIQLVKPEFDDAKVYLRISFFGNFEMTSNVCTIDSSDPTNIQYFRAYLNSGDSRRWVAPSAEGLGPEYDHAPVCVLVKKFLEDNSIGSDIVCCSFQWFWKDSLGVEHKSDICSSIFPATSELNGGLPFGFSIVEMRGTTSDGKNVKYKVLARDVQEI